MKKKNQDLIVKIKTRDHINASGDPSIRQKYFIFSVLRGKKEVKVGCIEVIQFKDLGLYDGQSAFWQLDAPSDATQGLYPNLFDKDGDIHSAVCEANSTGYFFKDLMFIDRVHVEPKFRKKGFGSKMIYQVLKRLVKKSDLIALLADPYELKADNAFPGLSEDEAEAAYEAEREKLISWYHGFGFLALSDSPYMLLCNYELADAKQFDLNLIKNIRETSGLAIHFDVELNEETETLQKVLGTFDP